MANQEHVEILKQGLEKWNTWRKEHPEIKPDLSGINFNIEGDIVLAYCDFGDIDFTEVDFDLLNQCGMSLDDYVSSFSGCELSLLDIDLRDVDLSGSSMEGLRVLNIDLRGANMNGAILSNTFFWKTDLTGATLTRADLCGAILCKTYLNEAIIDRGANLGATLIQDSELNHADFSGSRLEGACFRQVKLISATFCEADLREARFFDVNLRDADLSDSDLRGVTFNRADLKDANLTGARLIQTTWHDSKLLDCKIYGISAWNLELENTDQRGLIITDPDEPKITVDDLEVAQFIYLLLNYRKLRNVLNAVTERGVLLLGRFGGGGLEVLQAIAARLRDEKYLPIIFDFERPYDRDFTETVKTLAGLAHFIIADLSGPSVPKELEATVPNYKIPFAFICQADAKPFSMSTDLFGFPCVLKPALRFSTVEDLLAKLQISVIEPAKAMAEELRKTKAKTLDEFFPSE